MLAGFFRALSGVRRTQLEGLPEGPKVFYANHTSHLDFTVIWAAMPESVRLQVRPVAGRDYWIRNSLRRYVARSIFNALLIERKEVTRANNPVEAMSQALASGSSLIVFPEGTRGQGTVPKSFKPGLYHLHRKCPDVPMIPVYLQNLNRMMPKGTLLPIPLITHIAVGFPLQIGETSREEFLAAARKALVDLNPS